MEQLTLKTAIFIIIALVVLGVAIYWFLYTRGLKTRHSVLDAQGHPVEGTQEGIAAATQEKERTGRTGTIS